MKDISVNPVKLMRNTTLKITMTNTHEFHFRVWLATRILRLTAFILNCNIEIKE